MKRLQQVGFTILELMIATVIFSTILLLCTFGLLQIGRMYNRGIVDSSTQEMARNTIEDISQAIQFSGGQVITAIVPNNGSSGFCIGQRRYSVLLGREMADAPNQHALVVDKLTTSCSPAVQAQDLAAAGPLQPGSREFLAPFNRVSNLQIMAVDVEKGLYRITVRIAHGDDDLLSNPGGIDATCISQKGSEFCGVSELTTVVQKRIE